MNIIPYIYKTRQFLLLMVLVSLFTRSYAKLPEQCEIPGISVETIRMGYNDVIRYDYDTDRKFHPYFIESINSILAYYNSPVTLKKHTSPREDTTADYYINQLKAKNITIYRMDKLQGKTIRTLIYNSIPVLLIGKNLNNQRKITRIHGDVIYQYRLPDYVQSKRKLAEQKKYIFKTARGFNLESEEIQKPAIREYELDMKKRKILRGDHPLQGYVKLEREQINDLLRNPQKIAPFDYFEFYCVVVSPGKSLEQIKGKLKQELSGFKTEYQLPVFESLEGKVLTW